MSAVSPLVQDAAVQADLDPFFAVLLRLLFLVIVVCSLASLERPSHVELE